MVFKKKVLGPLLATIIINNPLQKTSGVFHSNLQVAQIAKFLYSVINRTKIKALKP